MTKSMVALQRIIEVGADGVVYLQLKAFIETLDEHGHSEDAEVIKDALDIVGRLIKRVSSGRID